MRIHHLSSSSPQPIATPKAAEALPETEPTDGYAGTVLGPVKRKFRQVVGAVQMGLGLLAAADGFFSPLLLPLVYRRLSNYCLHELTRDRFTVRGLSLKPPRAQYREESRLAWLAENTPLRLKSAIESVTRQVSQNAERSFGLSLETLGQMRQELERGPLATRDSQGRPQFPPLLDSLTQIKVPEELIRRGLERGRPGAAELARAYEDWNTSPPFVYLGPERQQEAEMLSLLFSHTMDAPTGKNPYQGSDKEGVWETLAQRARTGRMPVFIDTDGDLSITSPTEAILTEGVSSLMERHNQLGRTPVEFLRGLKRRSRHFHDRLKPWMRSVEPELHRRLEQDKADMRTQPADKWDRLYLRMVHGSRVKETPVSPRVFIELGDRLQKLTSARQADAITHLDRDLFCGTESHWLKLLKSLPSTDRRGLMKDVLLTWVELNLDQPHEVVAPANAPGRARPGPTEMVTEQVHYDRSSSLGEAVNHALRGLGVDERRLLVATRRAALRARKGALIRREERVQAWLPGYHLDVAAALRGGVSPEEAAPSLNLLRDYKLQLGNALADDLENVELREKWSTVSRHWEALDCLLFERSRLGEATELLRGDGWDELKKLGPGQDYGVSDFYVPLPGSPNPLGPGPRQAEVLGQGPPLPVTMVLEGGGGKGFAYVECLRQMREAMKNSREGSFAIEEYVGTSAGAITAGLLAAGYSVEELGGVMRSLDFKKFFSDQLLTGVDPKARGLDRSGLFSSQAMYRTVHQLLADKLDIKGRPVLFRDLPQKLKVVTTVLDTNLPPGHPLRAEIGADGQLVFSAENAPNLDVAAAIVASASIPGVFDPPQILIGSTSEEQPAAPYRMQLIDGGVVNNFAVDAATGSDSNHTILAVVPAFSGELSTLDFDADEEKMERVNENISRRYQKFTEPLITTLNRSRDGEDVERLVLGFNLCDPEEQSTPLLQGRSRNKTRGLHQLAVRQGLETVSPERGAAIIKANLRDAPGPGSTLLRKFVNYLTQEPGAKVLDRRGYHPPREEAKGLNAVLLGTAGAMASAHLNPSGFER